MSLIIFVFQVRFGSELETPSKFSSRPVAAPGSTYKPPSILKSSLKAHVSASATKRSPMSAKIAQPEEASRKSAVLRFSDEEESEEEKEEMEEERTPLRMPKKEMKKPSPKRPSAPATRMRKPSVVSEMRPEVDDDEDDVSSTLSKFAQFAPKLNLPVANAMPSIITSIPHSPMRTPSRTNIRKAVLPAFSDIFKSPAKPDFDTNENLSANISSNRLQCPEKSAQVTPTKKLGDAFADISTWTPASERKKAFAGSFIPPIAKEALTAKFIDEELSVSDEEGDFGKEEEVSIDEELLVEGYPYLLLFSISPFLSLYVFSFLCIYLYLYFLFLKVFL
jgi:hypothetical protein